MNRERLQRIIAWCGSVLLAAALIQRLYAEGPPYLQWPRTVLDHVWEGHHPQRDVLLVVPRIEPLIPRGADVTCFHPRNGEVWMDETTYLVAVGLLPHQNVVPPYAANPDRAAKDLVEYVIAVGERLNHPGYAEVAMVKDGWLYRRR